MPKSSDRDALRQRALKGLGDTTAAEEQRIAAGIAADPDNPELGAEFFAHAGRLRGPQKTPTKRLVSLRLDPDVVDYFRSTGPGWQGRMNAALRRAAGL